MDTEAELRKSLERCPWCGGRVQIIEASEPGELTLIACSGTACGSEPCSWSLTGGDADKALAAGKRKRTA
jgi:hypothetical protein